MMRSVKTVAGLSVASLLFAGCPKSPTDEISAAESALRAARDSGARDCAPEQFKSAEEMMARTYKLNDDEKFDKAKETAVTTRELAEVAKVESQRNTACKPGTAAGGAADDETNDGVRLGGRALSESEVAQELAETKTGAGALGDGVLVRGLKPVFFGFDDAALSADALAIVTENAEWLKDRPSVKVQVEGHTDERGTAEYNLSLGERRAKTVRDALVRLGIESARIKTISYGEETPAVQGTGDAAWSQNRRAEFVVQ